MQSLLAQSIDKIRQKFSAYGIFRSADVTYYDSLPANEKETYIKKVEKFWFTFGTLLGIVNELKLLITKIEELKPRAIPTSYEEHERMQALSSYWRLIYGDVYTLLSLLEGAKAKEQAKSYKELSYIRLLRNDFVQHPEINYPFESFGSSFGWKSDEKILPFAMFGPQSGGMPFYFEHFQRKAGGVSKDWEKMRKENKDIFIKKGGWKNLDENERARLKGWGLPEVDQEQFSKELETLFEKYIFPHLSQIIEAARRDMLI